MTGEKDISITAFLIAAIISSLVIESGSSKNFSSKLSSYSATFSTRFCLHSSTVSLRFSGISTTLYVIPISSSFHTIASLVIKSTTPLKPSSAPMGI